MMELRSVDVNALCGVVLLVITNQSCEEVILWISDWVLPTLYTCTVYINYS